MKMIPVICKSKVEAVKVLDILASHGYASEVKLEEIPEDSTCAIGVLFAEKSSVLDVNGNTTLAWIIDNGPALKATAFIENAEGILAGDEKLIEALRS